MIYTNVCQGTTDSLPCAKNELVYSKGGTWMPDQESICINAWYPTTKAFYKHQHVDRAVSWNWNKILTSKSIFLLMPLEMPSVIWCLILKTCFVHVGKKKKYESSLWVWQGWERWVWKDRKETEGQWNGKGMLKDLSYKIWKGLQ